MALIHATRPDKELQAAPQEMERKGLIPILLVERGKGNHRIVAEYAEIKAAVEETKGVGMFELQIEGEKKTRTVIVKGVERDTRDRTKFLMTLVEISDSDTLRIDVPVTYHGTPESVEQAKAILERPLTHVRVRARVGDLPDEFDIDLSELKKPGDEIHAGEIELPEGVELLTPDEATLFCLKKARAKSETKH
jgi:large subunit ribosomal protein L25